jgi:hypothetical protein
MTRAQIHALLRDQARAATNRGHHQDAKVLRMAADVLEVARAGESGSAKPIPEAPSTAPAVVRAARVDPPPVVRRRAHTSGVLVVVPERRCPVVSPAGPRCAMSEGHPGGHNCIGPWADDGDACRP